MRPCLRLRPAIVIIAVALMMSGCAAARAFSPPVPASPAPLGALTPAEQAVAAVALVAETADRNSTRPMFLMADTESWLPTDRELPPRPDDVPERAWNDAFRNLPSAVHTANAGRYSVGNLPLSPGFDIPQYRTPREFKRLVHLHGGQQPLVLRVSRPAFVNADEAHVVVTVDSTWNGCGGVNWWVVRRQGDGWVAELQDVLVIW